MCSEFRRGFKAACLWSLASATGFPAIRLLIFLWELRPNSCYNYDRSSGRSLGWSENLRWLRCIKRFQLPGLHPVLASSCCVLIDAAHICLSTSTIPKKAKEKKPPGVKMPNICTLFNQLSKHEADCTKPVWLSAVGVAERLVAQFCSPYSIQTATSSLEIFRRTSRCTPVFLSSNASPQVYSVYSKVPEASKLD